MATLRILKWVGIIIGLWIVVGLGISLFIPFPFSVPVVLFVVAVIAYLIRNRERKKGSQKEQEKLTKDR
jgi:membrane protein implicated in regulation of membrane protease activity